MDLVPGIRTKSASPGKGVPGATISTKTSGSLRSGSRSSKFEIRESIGTAILRFPPAREFKSTASSAGSFQASSNQVKTPADGQPVCSVIVERPPLNNSKFPLNLLTINPTICSESPELRTVFVPTSCAITPPRSISPNSTTGTSAAFANPMFAMSFFRRLVSAGLPAPSTMTRSACSATRLKLSSTGPNKLFLAV